MLKKSITIYKFLIIYFSFLLIIIALFSFLNSIFINSKATKIAQNQILEFTKKSEKDLLKIQVRGLHETINKRINEFNQSIKHDIKDYSTSIEEMIREETNDTKLSSLKSLLTYLENHEKYEYVIYQKTNLDKPFLESREGLRIDKQTLYKVRKQVKSSSNKKKYMDISQRNIKNSNNEISNYLTCINYINKGKFIVILFKRLEHINESIKNIIKLSVSGRKFGNRNNGYILILTEDGQILSYPYDEKGKTLANFNQSEVPFYLDAVKDKKSYYFEYKDENFKEQKFSFVKRFKDIFPKDIIIVATLSESIEREELFSLISKLTKINSYYTFWALVFYFIFMFLVVTITVYLLNKIKKESNKFLAKTKNLIDNSIAIEDLNFNLSDFKEIIPSLNNFLSYKLKSEENLRIIEEVQDKYAYNLGFVVDKSDIIVQILGNSLSFLGKTKEDILDRRIEEVFSNDIVEDIKEAINAVKDNRNFDRLLKYIKVNGVKIYTSINLQKISINNNSFILIYLKNITHTIILENIIKDISKEYRILFNASTDLILINKLDLQTFSTNLFMLNDTALSKLKYKEEELIGMPFDRLLDIENIKDNEKLVKDLAMGNIINFNSKVIRKDNDYFPAYIKGIPFELEDFHAVMFIIKDLSYERLLENEINESKSKIKNLFINTPAVSLVINLREGGKIIKANKAALDFYGFSEEELLKLSINFLTIQSSNESSFPFKIKASVEKTKHKTKEGLIKDVAVYFTPLNNDADIMVVVVHDLSEIKAEKKILFYQKNILKNVLNYQEEIIFYLDTHLRYIGVNKTFENFFKLDGETLIGVNYENLIQEEDTENSEIIKNNKSVSYEKWIIGKDEIKKLFKVFKYPILDDKNNTIALLCILKDITSLRVMEEELKKTKSEIEPTKIFKGNLLANLSHEIRTPLNGIIGIANMLLDTKLSDEQLKFLDIITKSSNSLLKIVNDILDITQMESGKYKINETRFSIEEVIAEISEIFKPQIVKKGLNINYKISSDMPEEIIGDAYKLRQILLNLIGNSIKFTDKGKIDIDVSLIETLEKDGNEYIYARFKISDTGIGIKEKDRGKLFKAFGQTNSELNSNQQGTGLGLVITKKLVEILGGVIEVSSTYGKGSVFSFSIKLQKINIINKLLQKVAVTGDIADEGKNLAFNISNSNGTDLTIFETPEKFDYKKELDLVVVIVDNDLKGYLEKNSAKISKLKGFKILILKDVPSDEEVKFIKKSDIISVLIGPTSMEEIMGSLKCLATEKEHQFKIWDFSKIKKKERIILLEDNEINSIIICDLIKKAGFEIVAYSTAQAALDKEDFRNVDLILGDINMPDINGIEATSIIRKITENFERHIPIIAITAYALPGDKEKCLKAGMDDYITKPIDKEILYEKVEKHLKDRFKKDKIIDEKIIEDAFDKNYELILKVIKIIENNIPKRVENLRKAVQENNFKEVESIAHSLKGTLGSIKPQGVLEILENLENSAKLKENDTSLNIIESLEKKLNLLLAAIRNIEEKLKKKYIE